MIDRIKNTQKEDSQIVKRIKEVKDDRNNEFRVDSKGVLRYKDRLCLPDVQGLRRSILEEAHHMAYLVHPRITKMYQDLKQLYWWERMKKDVADFV